MIHNAKKIIVIGGNAAGPAAAAKAKRVNPETQVIMFEAGPFISTGTCELPYLLSGEIDDYEKIVFFDADSFYKEKGVEVYVHHLVEEINRKAKVVKVRNLVTSEILDYEYDSLIIATGSKAKIPSGLSRLPENGFILKSVADYKLIKKFLDENIVNNVVVVGAGYIGLEVADAFSKTGKNVILLEQDELPMHGYGYEVRKLLKDVLLRNNIEFIPGVCSPGYNSYGNKVESISAGGKILETDLILFAIGVEPDNMLAVSSGIKIGEHGGIITDSYLRTSDPFIFAAGDVIEVKEKISNKNLSIPIATLAHLHGHIAGANAAGDRVQTDPVIRNTAVKIGDKVFSHVGLTFNEASLLTSNVESVSTVVPNLVHVMPGSSKVFGKIIFDKFSGKIFGAELLGSSEVTGYADLISTLIYKDGKISELQKINYNYTPPSSPFVNILSVLGRKSGKLNNEKSNIG